MQIHSTNRTDRMVSASPVYYGWVILIVGGTGMIMTSPGQTYAIAVFVDHIIVDLDISRSLISTLYAVGTLAGSLAMPFVGRQVDLRGARRLLLLVTLLFGLACIYMGTVQNAIMLGIGFVTLRMLGQGSLGLICINLINQWWIRRRGMAMSIAGVAVLLIGNAGFPIFINALIPVVGWRMTYAMLGIGLLLIMLPIAFVFAQNRPEDHGLQPDGALAEVSRFDVVSVCPAEDNWTLTDASDTSAFWLAAVSLASTSMLTTGLIFHIFNILEDSGQSSAVTAMVFLPLGVMAALAHLGSGLLIDRAPVRGILAASLFCLALTLIMAPFVYSVTLAYVFGVLLGTTQGLESTLRGVLWAKYFGRKHLGSITGVITTATVASSAIGPLLFGLTRDIVGSYTVVLFIFAALSLSLGLAVVAFGDPPRRRGEKTAI